LLIVPLVAVAHEASQFVLIEPEPQAPTTHQGMVRSRLAKLTCSRMMSE
jgi:hypothetical protein